MKQKNIIKGYLFAIISAVIYGCMPLMAKRIYNLGVNPMTLVLLRNLLAVPILAVLAHTSGQSLTALCEMGYIHHAYQRMMTRYYPLIINENSTLWEDFYLLGTRNHAWSGGPLEIAYKYFLGLATEDGFKTCRNKVFRYKYERGFIFSSSHFDGNRGKFPVGFLVWNLNKDIPLEIQTIVLDVYDENCEKVGTKQILTTSRDTFLNKWVPRYKNTHILPPFSSAISISDRTKDVRNRVADGFLCSMMCCGNDMQHQNYVCLLSGPQASAGSFSVVPENFERAMVTHAVRRIPKATWINDRDQFYQPFSDDLPQEFINDCVVWSAFAPSNNSAVPEVTMQAESVPARTSSVCRL